MSSECPSVEIVVASICSDRVGGELEMDTEYDISITPLNTPGEWLEEALEEARAETAGEHEVVVEKALEEAAEEAASRTIRVALPGPTRGENGIASAIADAVNEAMEGTDVTATAFTGETTPEGEAHHTGEQVAKVVIECVREVDVAWNHDKIACWVWGRPGVTGGICPLHQVPVDAPVVTQPPIQQWPPFPPSRPGAPVPGGLPGKPGGKGGTMPPGNLSEPSERMRRRLGGGGSDAAPGGHWRRVVLGVRFGHPSSCWSPGPRISEEWNAWSFRSLWLPPGLNPEEEAVLVLEAWEIASSADRHSFPVPITGLMFHMEGSGRTAAGRVHYQINLNPPGVEALITEQDLALDGAPSATTVHVTQSVHAGEKDTIQAEQTGAVESGEEDEGVSPRVDPALSRAAAALEGEPAPARDDRGAERRIGVVEPNRGSGTQQQVTTYDQLTTPGYELSPTALVRPFGSGRAWWQPAIAARPPWEAGSAWVPLPAYWLGTADWIRVPNGRRVVPPDHAAAARV